MPAALCAAPAPTTRERCSSGSRLKRVSRRSCGSATGSWPGSRRSRDGTHVAASRPTRSRRRAPRHRGAGGACQARLGGFDAHAVDIASGREAELAPEDELGSPGYKDPPLASPAPRRPPSCVRAPEVTMCEQGSVWAQIDATRVRDDDDASVEAQLQIARTGRPPPAGHGQPVPPRSSSPGSGRSSACAQSARSPRR
jgi:hypothetical protein